MLGIRTSTCLDMFGSLDYGKQSKALTGHTQEGTTFFVEHVCVTHAERRNKHIFTLEPLTMAMPQTCWPAKWIASYTELNITNISQSCGSFGPPWSPNFGLKCKAFSNHSSVSNLRYPMTNHVVFGRPRQGRPYQLYQQCLWSGELKSAVPGTQCLGRAGTPDVPSWFLCIPPSNECCTLFELEILRPFPILHLSKDSNWRQLTSNIV